MTDPFDDHLLDNVQDIAIAVPLTDLHPEQVIDETIDPSDWALQPEFSSFTLWCDDTGEFEREWRPAGSAPWRCQACGATDHRRIDTEEI